MKHASLFALIAAMLVPATLRADAEKPSTAQSGTSAEIVLDAKSPGRAFEGLGALSAGASSRLLFDYPEPQRSQVLDYLFKPKYGGAFQNLKVEIGGDVNSTCGTEPSQAHTREEFEKPKPEYFKRGYEWWLMKEARKRNPNILIGVLAWGAPGWMGTETISDGADWHSVGGVRKFFSVDNAEYTAAFIKAAQDVHGVRVDYAGIWNESPFDAEWTKLLRKTLDKNGLNKVKIVAADQTGPGAWQIAELMQKDPELMRTVDVIGAHYPGKYPELEKQKKVGPEDTKLKDPSAVERFDSRSFALATGKPIWSSEDGPWVSSWADLPYLTKSYIRNYVDGRMTSTIIWPLIVSHYPWTRHADSGAMRAAQPWCGYYEVQDPIWITAHITQFVEPGWRYLDNACGRLPGKGSYVALIKPGAEGDYSLVVETLDAKEPQDLVVHLAKGLSHGKLSFWTSNATERFAQKKDINPAGDSFTLHLDPGSIVSVSTVGGQQKGAVADIPQSKPFPFPYTEDFETYKPGMLAKYLADQSGSFEVVKRGDGKGYCYRQVVPQHGIWWHYPNPEPGTFLGNDKWTDYAVNCDVLIEGQGSVSIYGRVAGAISIDYKNPLPPTACWFTVTENGDWKMMAFKMIAFKNRKIESPLELASGACAFSPDAWHRLRMEFRGEQITAFVDGIRVGQAKNTLNPAGAAGFGSGWNYAKFDNLLIEPLK